MTQASELLKSAREAAGLSGRLLAARAGVAYSTVARIESGKVDPTTGMLARLLAAAGQELVMTPRRGVYPRLGGLVDAWHHDAAERQDRPDWTRLRAYLDFLRLHPEFTGPSTDHRPSSSGSPFMDNLLAAIAEKSCRDAGLPPPSWTPRVMPLAEPWHTRTTPAKERQARASTPPELAARGIIMAADSLWRDPETVGV